MKKILAFAGSNSSRSMNQALVQFAASQLQNLDAQILHLTDYPQPIYSEDLEREVGFSEALEQLYEQIRQADGLLIAVNEHNSGLSSFFKNVLDWLSRRDRKFLDEKPIVVLGTSPGGRGAISAIEYAAGTLPRFGAEVVSTFSLPRFSDAFSREEGRIVDPEAVSQLNSVLRQLENTL